MRRLAIVAAALLAAGCGHSPPTRFFTLDALPASRQLVPARISPVQLQAVHIPAVLDRPEMVSRIGANQLRIDDQDHWGAPLGEMLRGVLAQDLIARLPAGAIVLPGAPEAPGVRALVVNILQLQADAGGQVILQASWTLMAASPGRPAITRAVQLAVTSSATDPAGHAAAMSRLLGELADQIATVLASA